MRFPYVSGCVGMCPVVCSTCGLMCLVVSGCVPVCRPVRCQQGCHHPIPSPSDTGGGDGEERRSARTWRRRPVLSRRSRPVDRPCDRRWPTPRGVGEDQDRSTPQARRTPPTRRRWATDRTRFDDPRRAARDVADQGVAEPAAVGVASGRASVGDRDPHRRDRHVEGSQPHRGRHRSRRHAPSRWHPHPETPRAWPHPRSAGVAVTR